MKRHYYVRGFSFLFVFFAFLGLVATSCQMENGNKAKPSISVAKLNGQAQYVFSGQAIYRGVFFTQGEVAGLVPSLTSQMPRIQDYARNPAQLDSILSVQNRLVEGIQSAHPAFFDSLQTAVYSRQPEAIHNVIVKAAKYTQLAFQQLPEYQAKMNAINSAKNTLKNADYHQFTKQDGTFDREAFEQYAKQTMALGGGGVDRLLCIFFGVVFVAYWAIFVFGGIAVFGYIAVALAGGYYVAFAYDVYAYTPAVAAPTGQTLQEEMIINELASNVGGSGG